MERPTVSGLVEALEDPTREGMMYDQIQGIRNRVHASIIQEERMPRNRLISHSVGVLGKIVPFIRKYAKDKEGDPGHGVGHLHRDYIHALRLAHDESLPIECVIPTVIAGTLHDIGTFFVDRFAEKKRSVRHAEVGALIVRAAAIETGTMSAADADFIAFCIAAHTHYQQAGMVECPDGVARRTAPYPDMRDGDPVLEAWLPRWVDRLDCSGPCMVGRHYFTLHREHENFSREHGFYNVSFTEHMQPLFRTTEEIKAAGGRQTMTEHLRMFAQSQTNESTYGRHDRGKMVELRDMYRTMLERVLEEVANPTYDMDTKVMSLAWHLFLGMNIEPSPKGQEAAMHLATAFETLDPDTQHAWTNGFVATMREYISWSTETMEFLEPLPTEYLTMGGAYDDVRATVCPHEEWSALLVP